MRHLDVKLILASLVRFKCAQPQLGTSRFSLRSFRNGNSKTTAQDQSGSDGSDRNALSDVAKRRCGRAPWRGLTPRRGVTL